MSPVIVQRHHNLSQLALLKPARTRARTHTHTHTHRHKGREPCHLSLTVTTPPIPRMDSAQYLFLLKLLASDSKSGPKQDDVEPTKQNL